MKADSIVKPSAAGARSSGTWIRHCLKYLKKPLSRKEAKLLRLLSAQRERSPFSSDGEHPANCSHPVKPSHAQKVSESRTWKNSFCSGEPVAAFQREGISPGAQELASIGKLFSEFTSSVLLLPTACTCSSWYYAWISLFPQGLALNKWRANMGGYRSSSPAAPPIVGQFSPKFPGKTKPSDL